MSAPITSPFQRLTSRRNPEGGWRHHLAGEPLHVGSPLELLLPDGTWWQGRYEPAFPKDWQQVGPNPWFYGPLGRSARDRSAVPLQVRFALPFDAVLRHPYRQDDR